MAVDQPERRITGVIRSHKDVPGNSTPDTRIFNLNLVTNYNKQRQLTTYKTASYAKFPIVIHRQPLPFVTSKLAIKIISRSR